MKKRRIIICEESEIVASGLSKVLEGSALFEVVGIAERLDRIEEKIITVKPDIVIINPAMPGGGKIHSLNAIVSSYPDCCFAALVYNYCEQGLLQLFRTTIEINDGRQAIEGKLKGALAQESEDNGEERFSTYELSDRETEVLIAVAKGLLNKEIADSLNISIHTVITHRKNIVNKTGIKSVSGLTVYALINNLISESDVM